MSSQVRSLSRRQFIKGAAATAATLVAAGCAPPPTPAPAAPAAPTAATVIKPAGFDWKRFAGTTIDVLLPEHPIFNLQRDKLPEFEALTGIKVNSTSVPASTQYAQTLLQLTTAPDRTEVYLMVPPMQEYKYTKEGFVEDLQPYIKNPELTSPDWDAADMMAGPMASMNFRGLQGGLPLYVHTELFWYRRSLYDKLGLKAPETFEQLLENCKAIHDPANLMYGFAMRGIGPQAMWPWAQWLWGYGGSWVTGDLKANFAGPEGIEAARLYGQIMREYGPPGPTELDDGRYNTLWRQGNLGQMTQALHYSASFLKPEDSKVVDDMGCALYPGGPKGRFPLATGVGFAMSSKAAHKEASWYFMQWATSKVMVQAYQSELGQATCRQSAWDNSEFRSGPFSKIPGYIDNVLAQLSATQLSNALPPAEEVAAARDIIGVILTTAIQNGDIEKAAKEAAEKYEKLLAGVPKEELLPPTKTP